MRKYTKSNYLLFFFKCRLLNNQSDSEVFSYRLGTHLVWIFFLGVWSWEPALHITVCPVYTWRLILIPHSLVIAWILFPSICFTLRAEVLTRCPGWYQSASYFCYCVLAVMILGVTILRKKYPLAKYLCVLLIVSGVALFLYKPNKSSAVADDHIFGFGEILLVS